MEIFKGEKAVIKLVDDIAFRRTAEKVQIVIGKGEGKEFFRGASDTVVKGNAGTVGKNGGRMKLSIVFLRGIDTIGASYRTRHNIEYELSPIVSALDTAREIRHKTDDGKKADFKRRLYNAKVIFI